MARKYLTNIDLAKNELQNARTHNLAAAPSTPGYGQRYINTGDNTEYYWNGAAWIPTDAQKRTGIPLTNLATDPLARANHTGTQLATTISDLATTVKAYRLDEFAVPTADVAFGGKKITGLADPVSAQDAATMGWVQGQVQSAAAGIDSKASVRIVATANIAALSGLTAIDGVTPIAGDRILLTAQTTGSQNGVYVAAAGAWSRATDADQNAEVTPGAFWFVEEGTTYGKTQWRCNNSGAIVIGTTALTIVQFGAAASYTGGNGLVLTGNDFAVGAGSGITVTADAVAIDPNVVVRKYAATFGDGAALTYAITHSLNNQDVMTQVRDAASNAVVECDITNTSATVVTLGFASAPALNSLRVVVQG